MGNDWPTPWRDAVTCAVCDRRLLPLSFTPVATDDDPAGVEIRRDLQCPGCGQSYQWQDSAGWAPIGSVQLEGRRREGVWSRETPPLEGQPASALSAADLIHPQEEG